MAGRIPPPVPTAKGVRSAADPVLAELIDRSVRVPELKLPQLAARPGPDEISYSLLVNRESESVRGFLRSVREFGAVRINGHGILTEELRVALAKSERIFTLDCCTSYGDHEQLDWDGGGRGERRIAGDAAAAVGEQNYQTLRQKMDDASIKLEAIARELANVIVLNGEKRNQETFQFGESKLTIYRYHRANVIDPNSSHISEAIHESNPFALSLHLFLESTEFCLESRSGTLLSFETKPESLIVTTGKELEEWSTGEIKMAQGEFITKPYLHTSKASFSLQKKLAISILKPNKTISVWDQVLVVFIIALLYKLVCYTFS